MNKYDFGPITETIKKYYPIGLTKGHFDYPGLKELGNIFVDNVHNQNNFKLRWGNFENEIKVKTNKLVFGTTYGQDKCFSAYLELEKSSVNTLTRYKELYFFVSLAGPFYTIVGVDRNEIELSGKKIHSNNFLIISPDLEYKEIFSILYESIEARFNDFRFVPFFIYSQEIEGLDPEFKQAQNIKTVFNALFNNHINLNAQTVGNKYFGYDSWIRDDYKDTGNEWNINP